VNRQTAVAIAIGLVVVAVAVGVMLQTTRKHRVELTGSVLRLRSHSVDPETTVVFADIRVTNPSTQQFVVKEVDVYMDDQKGETFSETEAQRLFTYYPVLGKKDNPNLMVRQKVESGETIDRMVTVRFTGPDANVQARRSFRIVVTDADGAKTEIAEKR
jgi:hypothetical protein